MMHRQFQNACLPSLGGCQFIQVMHLSFDTTGSTRHEKTQDNIKSTKFQDSPLDLKRVVKKSPTLGLNNGRDGRVIRIKGRPCYCSRWILHNLITFLQFAINCRLHILLYTMKKEQRTPIRSLQLSLLHVSDKTTYHYQMKLELKRLSPWLSGDPLVGCLQKTIILLFL